MKHIRPTLVGVFGFSAVAMGLSGCIVAGGRVSGGAAIYYGPYRFWFYDGPGIDIWYGNPADHASTVEKKIICFAD